MIINELTKVTQCIYFNEFGFVFWFLWLHCLLFKCLNLLQIIRGLLLFFTLFFNENLFENFVYNSININRIIKKSIKIFFFVCFMVEDNQQTVKIITIKKIHDDNIICGDLINALMFILSIILIERNE